MNTQIVQSTTFAIVIISTILLGGMMPGFINWMFRCIQNNPKYNNKTTVLGCSEIGETEKEKNYESGSQKKWKIFDNHIMKPFFIYNFNERKEEI